RPQARFHRLTKLAFYRLKFSLDVMNVLIKSCEETLREIQIRGTISDNSPSEVKRARLTSMFTGCSKLEHLEFHSSLFSFGTSSEIMDELSDAIPSSLLEFYIDCKCSPQELGAFLEKCNACLRHLALDTDDKKANIDEILVIVRKYAISKKSLKKLILAGLSEQSIDSSRELEATRKVIKVDTPAQYT
ncbi:1346_t:CDS:1, partial [Racocetra persica]